MPYVNKAKTACSFREAQRLYPSVILHRDHPENWPDGPWRWEDPEPVAPTLEQTLSRKQNEVRNDAELSYREPVTDPDSRTWNGGFDSAMAIKSAADMAEFAGLTTLSIFDSSNTEHIVMIEEAKAVAAGIGAAYEAKFAAKQAAMRALSFVDLQSEDAVGQLNAISFSNYQPASAPEEPAVS